MVWSLVCLEGMREMRELSQNILMLSNIFLKQSITRIQGGMNLVQMVFSKHFQALTAIKLFYAVVPGFPLF